MTTWKRSSAMKVVATLKGGAVCRFTWAMPMGRAREEEGETPVLAISLPSSKLTTVIHRGVLDKQ